MEIVFFKINHHCSLHNIVFCLIELIQDMVKEKDVYMVCIY